MLTHCTPWQLSQRIFFAKALACESHRQFFWCMTKLSLYCCQLSWTISGSHPQTQTHTALDSSYISHYKEIWPFWHIVFELSSIRTKVSVPISESDVEVKQFPLGLKILKAAQTGNGAWTCCSGTIFNILVSEAWQTLNFTLGFNYIRTKCNFLVCNELNNWTEPAFRSPYGLFCQNYPSYAQYQIY